jgi:dephospho-CoA kinase
MVLVGLTGGIGAGKSTVARMLAERGAVVLDADDLARQAVEPGTPGYRKVVEQFGHDILLPTGEIDRKELGSRIFADRQARRALESVVHPEVFRLLADAVERHRATDDVVVFDAPLIVETGLAGDFDLLVVVLTPGDVAVARLKADRGMPEDVARARIAAQAPPEMKEAAADVVIRNEGSLEDLQRQVDALWADLLQKASTSRSETQGDGPGEL